MAYYEFVCRECGHGFTEKRTFAEASRPAACPMCASDRTQKRFGAFAVIGSSSREARRESIPLTVGNGGGCGCGGGGCGCHN